MNKEWKHYKKTHHGGIKGASPTEKSKKESKNKVNKQYGILSEISEIVTDHLIHEKDVDD